MAFIRPMLKPSTTPPYGRPAMAEASPSLRDLGEFAPCRTAAHLPCLGKLPCSLGAAEPPLSLCPDEFPSAAARSRPGCAICPASHHCPMKPVPILCLPSRAGLLASAPCPSHAAPLHAMPTSVVLPPSLQPRRRVTPASPTSATTLHLGPVNHSLQPFRHGLRSFFFFCCGHSCVGRRTEEETVSPFHSQSACRHAAKARNGH